MSTQGWQPIATIPTDGTEVLAAVYVRSSVRGEGWWERHVIAIDDETGEVHDSLYGGWDRGDYSYWHTLPDAPEEPS